MAEDLFPDAIMEPRPNAMLSNDFSGRPWRLTLSVSLRASSLLDESKLSVTHLM